MKSFLKSAAYSFFSLARDILDPFFHFEEVSILGYHSISDAAIDTAVTSQVFASHLALLRDGGVQFVSLDAVRAWQRGQGALPRKAVAITFDDGYADFETAALPLLEHYAAPVTLFVVGDVARSRPALQNDIPLLSQAVCARLAVHPLVTLGYHSRTHADLSSLSGPELEAEIAPTFPTRYFAYPGGRYNEVTVRAVREAGYDAALSIKPTLVTRQSDPFVLPRSVITRGMRPWEVRLRTTKAIAWYRASTQRAKRS